MLETMTSKAKSRLRYRLPATALRVLGAFLLLLGAGAFVAAEKVDGRKKLKRQAEADEND